MVQGSSNQDLNLRIPTWKPVASFKIGDNTTNLFDLFYGVNEMNCLKTKQLTLLVRSKESAIILNKLQEHIKFDVTFWFVFDEQFQLSYWHQGCFPFPMRTEPLPFILGHPTVARSLFNHDKSLKIISMWDLGHHVLLQTLGVVCRF